MSSKVISEFISRIEIQEDMGAFTGTEFNARDDKRIKRIITGFKRPFDLVVIRNRNPNPEVFRPAEERGNTDRGIRVLGMDMHIHRSVTLLPDLVKKRGFIAYFMMMRADHTDSFWS